MNKADIVVQYKILTMTRRIEINLRGGEEVSLFGKRLLKTMCVCVRERERREEEPTRKR